MKHLFLPYELSRIAKEKGFDEPCIAEWVNGFLCPHAQWSNQEDRIDRDTHSPDSDFDWYTYTNNRPNWMGSERTVCSAPLYQQIIDWLEKREVFIDACVDISDGTFKWYYKISTIIKYKFVETVDNTPYKSKTDALNQALQEAFKLI
jgi:hypothetical protein